MTDITELAQRARINAECGEYLSPAETMELVEALESEKRICSTWRKTAESTSEKLEKAQQRISQLESRTVTVKLPPKVDSSNIPFAGHTWNCCLDEVEKRLAAAGIKVEVE